MYEITMRSNFAATIGYESGFVAPLFATPDAAA